MQTFNPERLRLIRQRRGLHQADVAEAADLTIKSVNSYEAGKTEPTAESIDRLAAALSVPASFFTVAKTELPAADAVSFRSMTSLTAAQRDAAIGAGAIAIDLTRWIDKQFSLPEADIPDLRELSPEDAADAVREQWGLGVKPIKNMVHLLEFHGVRVFSLAEKARELDAYSLWHGSLPLCFLNTMKSVEHSRFDAAHELGHLVLHRAGTKATADSERQANQFAAAFLMPKVTVLEHVPRGATLERLIKLKKKWGVSAAALVHRIHGLPLISDWQHRLLQIEIARRGYRTTEPEPIKNRETSQILNKVFASLRRDGTSKSDVARDLCLYTHDLDAIVFGLTMTSLAGGSAAGPKTPKRTGPTNLQLVLPEK
jgi:Zn-dependent peptidase ImmA (M78 family)/DNA-binding XRE family transcriptional regulator